MSFLFLTAIILIFFHVLSLLIYSFPFTKDYKWARGFDPALIHSVHYICHPGLRRAVGQFLIDETENNVELTKYLLERSAVGNRQALTENADKVL